MFSKVTKLFVNRVIDSINRSERNNWDVKAESYFSYQSPWISISHNTLFLLHTLIRVGDGSSLRFWEDHWLRKPAISHSKFPSYISCPLDTMLKY